MWTNLDIWYHGYVWGFVTPFVVYYVVTRFGTAIWEDVKKIAYSTWDKMKSKAPQV